MFLEQGKGAKDPHHDVSQGHVGNVARNGTRKFVVKGTMGH